MCVYICVTTERNQTLLVTLDLQILAIKSCITWFTCMRPEYVGASLKRL